ncbi:MAG: hypothetical protein KGJ06_06955 [Pseudomonadota bacterium]|nr:hypothetical protein [Pseudomonadota bacterium]
MNAEDLATAEKILQSFAGDKPVKIYEREGMDGRFSSALYFVLCPHLSVVDPSRPVSDSMATQDMIKAFNAAASQVTFASPIFLDDDRGFLNPEHVLRYAEAKRLRDKIAEVLGLTPEEADYVRVTVTPLSETRNFVSPPDASIAVKLNKPHTFKIIAALRKLLNDPAYMNYTPEEDQGSIDQFIKPEKLYTALKLKIPENMRMPPPRNVVNAM